MLRLPKEMVLYCCSYLPCSDIYGLRTLISPLRGIDRFAHRIQTIRECFPRPIIDGRPAALPGVPDPGVEGRLYGLHGLHRQDPAFGSLRSGHDRQGWLRQIVHRIKDNEFVVALFQRYTDNPWTWTHGKRGCRTIIQGCGRFMLSGRWRDENARDILSKLSDGGTVIIGGMAYALAF